MRLAAERRRWFLVEQQHATTRIGEFRGGDQAGQPRADNDDVSVHVGSLSHGAARHG
jgi:hypothetical protein